MAVELPYTGIPYERQPGETELWYQRFTIYMGMGVERSVMKALRGAGANEVSIRQWEEKCAENRWVERAKAYDNAFSSKLITDLEKKRTDMAIRHMEQSLKAQKVIMRVIDRMSELVDDKKGGLDRMALVPTTANVTREDGTTARVRMEGLLPLMGTMVKSLREMQGAEAQTMGEPESVTQLQVTGPGGGPLTVANVSEEQSAEVFRRLQGVVRARFGDQGLAGVSTEDNEDDGTPAPGV
jgi:hypothetical protein